MKHSITSVILAGGNCKRLGRSKAQLPVGEKRMIEWIVRAMSCLFSEVIVVTHQPQLFSTLENVTFVQDSINTPSRNSLVGLYTGLMEASHDTIFVVACDMPLLNRKLIEHMVSLLDGEDVRVPIMGSHYQPLHAFYRKSCLPYMRESIETGIYKVTHFYDEVLVRTVDEKTVQRFDPQLISFLNVNTEEDYQRLLMMWEEHKDRWYVEWSDYDQFNGRSERKHDKHRSIGIAKRKG